MARALRAWAINRNGKNSVRNLRYGPRTRLVRGIYSLKPRSQDIILIYRNWPIRDILFKKRTTLWNGLARHLLN